jgi:hypothetical protein
MWVDNQQGGTRAWPVMDRVDALRVAREEIVKLKGAAEPNAASGHKKREGATAMVGQELRRTAWKNAVCSMVMRLYAKCTHQAPEPRVGFTAKVKEEWVESAKQKRVHFLCTERVVMTRGSCEGAGRKTWKDVDPEGIVLPGPLSQVAVNKKDLTDLCRRLRRSVKKDAGAPLYVFVGCVCTVMEEAWAAASKGELYTGEEPYQTFLLSQPESKDRSQRVAFHVAGLGFLAADDPCLRLAMPGEHGIVTTPSKWATGEASYDTFALPVESFSCPALPESFLAIARFGTGAVAFLETSPPERDYLSPDLSCPYLFHYRDAPRGLADLVRLRENGHGTEGAVLCFLRVLCAWAKCEEYGGAHVAPADMASSSLFCEEVRAQALRKVKPIAHGDVEYAAGLLVEVMDRIPGRTRPDENTSGKRTVLATGAIRSKEASLLSELGNAWHDYVGLDRGPQSPCTFGGVDAESTGEAFYQEERMATWTLLYVFCGSPEGRAFFSRTLLSYWRTRLRALTHVSMLHATVRRTGMVEQLIERSHTHNYFSLEMETVLDHAVQIAQNRLELAFDVAAAVLEEANEEAVKRQVLLPFNHLLLQCHSLFAQWNPEFVSA